MEAWIEFGKGPLFRLAFVIMLLGLIRALFLVLVGMVEAYHRAGDRVLPWADLHKKTLMWMFPVKRIFNRRPVYSIVSFIWHIGLILVPIFYSAHVLLLMNQSLGVTWWPVLAQDVAHILTWITVAGGVLLFLMRYIPAMSRRLSKFMDGFWVVLITAVFVTGAICAQTAVSAYGYQVSMLIHIYGANLILVLLPFSKTAHSVLFPLGQYAGAIGWKFPKGAGAKVRTTIGKEVNHV
ncbi:hypothetical protein GF324_06745 [bacterium]|nr:hypothetical protein [bacterium]